MSTVFFIADTHFGHRAVLRHNALHRPFHSVAAHDAELIRLWNSLVGQRDTVWHLGDVAWTKDALFECLPQLNGQIKLVMGNHDTFDVATYYNLGVRGVYGCVDWKRGTVLTHMPLYMEGDRYTWNIHGHTHDLGAPSANRHICVSVEQTGLAPLAMDELWSMIDGT